MYILNIHVHVATYICIRTYKVTCIYVYVFSIHVHVHVRTCIYVCIQCNLYIVHVHKLCILPCSWPVFRQVPMYSYKLQNRTNFPRTWTKKCTHTQHNTYSTQLHTHTYIYVHVYTCTCRCVE